MTLHGPTALTAGQNRSSQRKKRGKEVEKVENLRVIFLFSFGGSLFTLCLCFFLDFYGPSTGKRGPTLLRSPICSVVQPLHLFFFYLYLFTVTSSLTLLLYPRL